MSNKSKSEYYDALFQRESSGDWKKLELRYGNHYGGFQMSKGALADVGYYDIKSGNWTGKDGINSKEDFLNNQEIQRKATEHYHQIIWERQNFSENVGQKIGEITLDKSGIIAAAHLVGDKGLKDFFKSGGEGKVPRDGNGVPWSEYAHTFAGYELEDLKSAEQRASELNAHVEQLPEKYTIQSGDNISTIAQKHGITTDYLMKVPGNEYLQQRKSGDNIAINPGEIINLKSPGVLSTNNEAMQKHNDQTQSQQQTATDYKIKQGDTLSQIAQKNNLSLEQLLNIQGNEQFKTNPNAILPGQSVQLQAPTTQSENQEQQMGNSTYNVKKGDTLSEISQTQGKNLEELLELPGNEKFKENPNAINPGNEINLGDSENGVAESNISSEPSYAPQTENSDIHNVTKGDTLSEIAERYGTTTEDLASKNDISNPDHIEVGQKINI